MQLAALPAPVRPPPKKLPPQAPGLVLTVTHNPCDPQPICKASGPVRKWPAICGDWLISGAGRSYNARASNRGGQGVQPNNHCRGYACRLHCACVKKQRANQGGRVRTRQASNTSVAQGGQDPALWAPPGRYACKTRGVPVHMELKHQSGVREQCAPSEPDARAAWGATWGPGQRLPPPSLVMGGLL